MRMLKGTKVYDYVEKPNFCQRKRAGVLEDGTPITVITTRLTHEYGRRYCQYRPVPDYMDDGRRYAHYVEPFARNVYYSDGVFYVNKNIAKNGEKLVNEGVAPEDVYHHKDAGLTNVLVPAANMKLTDAHPEYTQKHKDACYWLEIWTDEKGRAKEFSGSIIGEREYISKSSLEGAPLEFIEGICGLTKTLERMKKRADKTQAQMDAQNVVQAPVVDTIYGDSTEHVQVICMQQVEQQTLQPDLQQVINALETLQSAGIDLATLAALSKVQE